MKKNHGESLPDYWVDAPCGYNMTTKSCHSCENFWMVCQERFGNKTGKDKFCHYKKSKFFVIKQK